MSALLAAIGTGLLGLALGAALQRWGDKDRATHGHKDYTAVDNGWQYFDEAAS